MQSFESFRQRTSVIHSNGFSSLSCVVQRLPKAVTCGSETSSTPYQQKVRVSLQFVALCCQGYLCDCPDATTTENKIKSIARRIVASRSASQGSCYTAGIVL